MEGKAEEYLPRNLDDQYAALKTALDRENRLLDEIDSLFASMSNRVDAEKLVANKYAPLLEVEMSRTAQALAEWLSALRQTSVDE